MSGPKRTSCWLPAAVDGCALYRIYMPQMYTPRSKFIPVRPGGLRTQTAADTDVAVAQRQCSAANIKALGLLQSLGIRVLVDLDDNFWTMPAANPGKVAFEMAHGGFKTALGMANVITVSTEYLKSVVTTALPRLSTPIFVVENQISFQLFGDRRVPREDGMVTVGWAGSNTHAGDIGMVWEILPELLEHPKVRLEIVGMRPPAKIQNHPRVLTRAWVPVSEYPAAISSWGWDISLAPLDDNRFNRSKTNIKQLEAAVVGAAALVSPVGPYEKFCGLDSELRWTMCWSSVEWKRKILELVEEEGKRKYLVERARKLVRDHYDIEKGVEKWYQALDS